MKRAKAKKGMEKAEISALLVQKKSFSLQRLMHDYEEIKKQVVPIPGVSAVPLDDDFYEWHGNIKALTDNLYKGAVMHFKLTFPRDYPLSPPTVYLLNKNIKHPNVLSDNKICLDIFEKNKDAYKGWKSGYTVLSILLQLQTFFFDIDTSNLSSFEKENIKNEMAEMAEFKCPNCKHRGSSNPYPEFPKIEIEKTKLTNEQYLESKKQEICCYHRKTTFQEAPLGLGINITKIPRTGEIKGVAPCFDFVSLKSYTKERLRVSFNGEHFTHWFPLYFGEKKDKFLNSVTKALSMIAKGNTKEFKTDLILKVMPKFFNYVCLNILSEKVHNSSRAIQILIYIFRILILLAKEYPDFKNETNKNIEKFIKDPNERIKDKTASLGDLLVMLSVSDHKIEELLESYMSEQMDRQIFWILQELPQLETLMNSNEVDDIRGRVCFKCGLVGEQLLLFYYYFLKKIVYNDVENLDQFAEKLDKNFGNLTDEEIDKHRIEINKILKIDSFNQYYEYLGITPPSKEQLNEKLKQAFLNSKNKGYHGTDEVRYVPPQQEQVKFYMNKYEPLENYLQDGKLLDAENTKWKDSLNKFDIVNEYKYTFPNKEITPLSLIRFYREKMSESLLFDTPNDKVKKDCNKIGSKINKRKFVKKVEDEEIIEKLSWKQVYIKFYLEEYCKFFPYIADFKQFYKILDLVKNEVVHFSFNISSCGNLKSDFNYVRVLLSKLTSLKYLELIFSKEITIKLLKNLVKGVSNGLKEKAAIEHLKIITNNNVFQFTTKELNILTILDNMPSLKILDVSNVVLDINKVLRIRNHLYYYKKISVLDLSNCHLNDNMSNELADGIMKAKALEKLYISNNEMQKGLANILYNLAFQPSIKIINISNNSKADLKEVSTSLHKFIKMSQTVECIIANNIKDFNKQLTNEFYYSLGDNNSLVYLDLSSNGAFSNINDLGKSISFNALKNGSLAYLDISKCDLYYNNFKEFLKGMSVSENDHNKWYGFQFNSNIQKESKEYFELHFHCNLKTLVLTDNNIICDINYLDPKNANVENPIKTFLTNSKNLDTLILGNYNYNKFFLDAIADALRSSNNLKYFSISNSQIDGEKFKSLLSSFYAPIPQQEKKEGEVKPQKEILERTPNLNFHIEELDLSNNKLGYSGIETLSNALKINKTIKCLNLFHNLFDVNGARRLEEVLKVNNSLLELDIGYNRIKNVGFNSIMNGIKENKNLNLKYLGVKYNFITNDAFKNALNIIEENKDSIKLEEIDIRNNPTQSGFLVKCWEDFKKMTKKIKIDVFDVLYFLEPDRLERTVWIPISVNSSKLCIDNEILRQEKACVKKDKSHVGIVLYLRKKRGRKTGQKKDPNDQDAFIEFIMPNSVNRMLKIGSTSNFMVDGKKRKIFKAGTKPDYLVVKKKLVVSNNVFELIWSK